MSDPIEEFRRLAAVMCDYEESKHASSEAVASLSRWLKGATPAVGSYVKKIANGDLNGIHLRKEAQEALTLIVAALGAMHGAIESLNSNLPILLDALGA